MKALFAAALLLGSFGQAFADTLDIDALPVSTIFVTSSGMWEREAAEDTAKSPQTTDKGAASRPEPTRGYYKVVAMRQPDGTAKIYLQQIAYTANGPALVETLELEEFTQMKAYVTDIRPESSAGASSLPGLFVTVHLKTDPAQKEPDAWTILIDELGDMKIEKASN
ncbi:hypothetical protein QE369_002641 [Agrobacterium larrymoorei]|uniref:Uncharacterized protein n=1 Tax=Agrobacterium larrymoorei TaxID=160699 RepID=A0AAJ2ES23_9HYPH|nr:hypothetical protein [Agrobacterium larrymoorei]MDR6102444.1 hypothetical protein [Agrobacterium larrymoorei]